jgi:choline dehydrogenase-like flavoprotein
LILDLPSADPASLRDLPSRATVVVGAGAAGLALALSLEDAGLPVVLVESGGDPRDQHATDAMSVLNVGAVAGHPYAGLTEGRARVLGGATQLWHGQCTRLHDTDVAIRDWVPNSGWPVSLAELEPWYDQAERWFGLSGRGYDGRRWEEHRSVSPIPWSADKLLPDFAEYTPTPHLGSRHRHRLEGSALVTVLQHATVAKVVLDGDQATGVEVRTLDGRSEVVRGSEIVLAAGAIENARILMLSDPEGVGLGAGRELTGRYLQDHPVVEMLQIEPLAPAWLQDRSSHLHRGKQRLWPKVRLAPAAQQRERLLDANAVLVHEYPVDANFEAARRLVASLKERRLPERPLSDLRAAVGATASVVRTGYRRWFRGLSAGRRASRVTLQVWLEQVPDRNSRVRLGGASDPLGLPVAEVDWRLGDAEMRTSRVFGRWVAEDLRQRGLAQVVELPAMTDDAAWRAAAGDAYHPAGTTRMAESPTEGVVDVHGRVHGVSGLYVAGSSVFPIAGYANPTLTIVALSLRLGAHLVASRHSDQLVA